MFCQAQPFKPILFQVARVWRGQGDQWDNRARARGVTASFSLNGIGLVPEETADLYQENEELKVVFLTIISVTTWTLRTLLKNMYDLYSRCDAIALISAI